jgi:DNA-binding XRE family transcriptional regulator
MVDSMVQVLSFLLVFSEGVRNLRQRETGAFRLLCNLRAYANVAGVPAPIADLRALGVGIARLRRERGISIDLLAELAGVHRKSIIQIEAGRVAAKISTLHGIAHALGVPLPDLIAPVCERHPKSIHTSTRLV